jgi:hypothetical protein
MELRPDLKRTVAKKRPARCSARKLPAGDRTSSESQPLPCTEPATDRSNIQVSPPPVAKETEGTTDWPGDAPNAPWLLRSPSTLSAIAIEIRKMMTCTGVKRVSEALPVD